MGIRFGLRPMAALRLRIAGAPGSHRGSSERQAPGRQVLQGPRRLLVLLLPLLLALRPVAPVQAGTATTHVEVLLAGMNCALCTQGLERRLRRLPGAETVRLDVARGRLSLTLRPGSTIADDTLRTLMRDAGFVVREIRRTTAPR